MSYYCRHAFVCENRRTDGTASCDRRSMGNDVATPVSFMRRMLLDKEAHGKGKIRVNRSGCFNRCQQGPVLVVYPDNIWYQYTSTDDLSEIVSSHLLSGKIVERLRLPND